MITTPRTAPTLILAALILSGCFYPANHTHEVPEHDHADLEERVKALEAQVEEGTAKQSKPNVIEMNFLLFDEDCCRGRWSDDPDEAREEKEEWLNELTLELRIEAPAPYYNKTVRFSGADLNDCDLGQSCTLQTELGNLKLHFTIVIQDWSRIEVTHVSAPGAQSDIRDMEKVDMVDDGSATGAKGTVVFTFPVTDAQ